MRVAKLRTRKERRKVTKAFEVRRVKERRRSGTDNEFGIRAREGRSD